MVINSYNLGYNAKNTLRNIYFLFVYKNIVYEEIIPLSFSRFSIMLISGSWAVEGVESDYFFGGIAFSLFSWVSALARVMKPIMKLH